MACAAPTATEACFLDEHCPNDLMCLDGTCSEPGGTDASGDDDVVEKLDVSNSIGDATTCAAVRLTASNAGCEFWAVDLPNSWGAPQPYSLDVAAEQTFAVVVANTSPDDNARVEIFGGDSDDAIESAIVGPLGTYAFLMPNDLQTEPDRNSQGQAFRVESDIPITAYQFQPLDNLRPVYSNDASSLLPAHVLGSDYIAGTYWAIPVNQYPSGWEPVAAPTGAFVTAVATEDDTEVVFVETAALLPGNSDSIVLDRGETFTIISDPLIDDTTAYRLSGTRVLSNKPVAAFAGNTSTAVPVDGGCCADHIEHQLLPSVAWGNRYVVALPPDSANVGSDNSVEVEIIGAHEGTQLAYPAGQPADAPDVIGAHESVTFRADASLIVESTDPTKPISVVQYLLSTEAANPDTGLGDPGMIVLPSVEQLMERYVFLVPPGYQVNAVTITAPHDAAVELDDESVGNSKEIGEVDGQTWGYRRASIGAGVHVLESDQPFGVTVIGYDDAVSYAYAGGSAVEAINDAPPTP